MTALFRTLEEEFCPPLDSSLLAALLAEVETDTEDKSFLTGEPQIVGLRNVLRELASHAEEVQLFEFAESNSISPTETTISSQDPALSGSTMDTSVSSGSSRLSVQSFGTPLEFLQASLPDTPVNTLKQALKDVEESGRKLDMWNLIGNILSQEYTREMEERGLGDNNDVIGGWEFVPHKSREHHGSASPDKRKRSQATKITLVDIRQQNHRIRQHRKSGSAPKPPLPDLWTQVQSIATNISAYLSPHPLSFFLSYLHSPQYESPYQALLAALECICKALPSRDTEENATLLRNLLEVIFPEYEPLDFEQRSRLVHETELCILATSGRGEDVIDLVRFLRELSLDASSGTWDLGIYHLPPHKPPPSPTIPKEIHKKRKKASPICTPLTPQISSCSLSLPSPVPNSAQGNNLDPYEWQSIPVRRTLSSSSTRLAHSIPAYARVHNGYDKDDTRDLGQQLRPNNKIKEHRRQQEEYLKQAAKIWQRGDKKFRGETAFYYAEKAREFQELVKQEALINARAMVNSRRASTGKYDEIDLHGTTVYEAVTIVKEILLNFECSPSQPLKIITGKGSHSTNKVAVLKPAIRNALLDDGWVVGTWNAGLVVRGRSS